VQARFQRFSKRGGGEKKKSASESGWVISERPSFFFLLYKYNAVKQILGLGGRGKKKPGKDGSLTRCARENEIALRAATDTSRWRQRWETQDCLALQKTANI